MTKSRYFGYLKEIKESQHTEIETADDKILIIDGLNTFIRCFAVNPASNDDGTHIGGIVGFLKSIGYAIKLSNPTRCIITFDGKGGSKRRRKVFPAYKNNRKPTTRFNRTDHFLSKKDEQISMAAQLQRLVQYLEQTPVTILSIDQVEADDVMSYISEQIYPNSEKVIMSTDKDFLQLVDDKTRVWSPTKKKMYTKESLFTEYGISSNNFLLYRVLDGDKSDSVPGIKGAGLKTIQKRFPAFSDENELTIENLISYSDEHKTEAKIYQTILEAKDQLELNYKLMQLKNVDISGTAKLKINEVVNYPIQRLVKFQFQKMVMEDKLYTAFPDINSWLVATFNVLHTCAEMTHKKED